MSGNTDQVRVPTELVVTPASPTPPLDTDVFTMPQDEGHPIPTKDRKATPGLNQTFGIRGYGLGTSATYGVQLPMRKVPEDDEQLSGDGEHLSGGDEQLNALSDDESQVGVMSPAAQAAALSTFLSVTNSDSDEAETQARITDVYREPLDLDGLETLVLSILRTGRLTIQGTPGDAVKIQPALFALQANEKDLPQILPQLMQSPLFNPRSSSVDTAAGTSGSLLPACSYDLLQSGQIRIGIYVDTAIYTLLKGHCAKNAKQAEAIISTLMVTNYIPVDSFLMSPSLKDNHKSMPPMIFHSSLSRRPSTTLNNSEPYLTNSQSSGSSISTSTSGASLGSQASSSSVDDDSVNKDEARDKFGKKPSDPSFKSARSRRDSKIQTHHMRIRSNSSEMSDDEGAQSSWKTCIEDNSMLVCQYGNNTYPLLMWNPKLKVDFHVKSSLGPLCGAVTGVDPSNRTVTAKIVNNASQSIAFSIRSFRQSTIFVSRVVYPQKGLHILEPGQSWEDNVELFPQVKDTAEIFVMDLLVCTMGEHPSWNVHRKYAAMRVAKSESSKSQHLSTKRLSKKRASIFYMPGTKDQKEENLKVILSHGLQCVVKGKLQEAEIIFTQALLLPDFQRIELKAFLYICLAVVANKRQSKGHYDSLLPVLNEVSAASQLVDAVEATPGPMRMPRMMQLVKQLEKELDVRKIFTEFRQKSEAKRLPRVDDVKFRESVCIPVAGGTLSCGSTTMTIQPDSIRADTRVTLSVPDLEQLNSMLQYGGWDSTVHIVAAVQVDCNPILGHFRNPLEITVALTDKPRPSTGCLRLIQSNYLRHWRDITDDSSCSVEIQGNQVSIRADRPGWLAVTSIHFDPSLIVVKAMQSLSVEPLTLHLAVFGLSIPDSRIYQIATFISPGDPPKEIPKHHLPIAFKHSIQAYPGERLQLAFHGQMEPETAMNEQDMSFEFTVNRVDTSVCEKWLRLTSAINAPLNGKIVVSCCRRMVGEWDKIAEIRLSNKTGCAGSNASSSS